MKNKKPVADSQGRIINPGEFHDEEIDAETERILADARTEPALTDAEKLRRARGKLIRGEKPKPYFSEGLVRQYEFFRKNVYEPKRVFYPCCNFDLSPIRGFPNSEVVLVDKEEGLGEIMKQAGISQFIQGDVLKYVPENPFDLVIALNPCLLSRELTRHLDTGGYVLANNWHNNASQLLEDSGFDGIGTIDRNEKGIFLARGDFSKIEPNQFINYFYVFRKIKGEEK